MAQINKLKREQVFHAIESGEFGDDITGSGRSVVVVMTQDWCPFWKAMRDWLHPMDNSDGPIIYELIYNQEDFFKEFKRFKESVWENHIIPYVRYYRDGKLVGESNNVSREIFLEQCGF
jgi:hypothetical protein